MINALALILILSFLVFIHEFGHFLAARWAGVEVKEFGLGYPPLAKKLFTWQGTDFTLNWIPFGGFVRMEGEDEDFALPEEKKPAKKLKAKGAFFAASTQQKLAIIFSGAAANFLFGVLAFSVAFSIMGIPEDSGLPIIGSIDQGSPAEAARLQPGTKIAKITVDGQETSVSTTSEVIEIIDQNRGKEVQIVTVGPCENGACAPEEQTYSVYLRTQEETPDNRGSLGIAFDTLVFTKYAWWQMPLRGIVHGIEQALYLSELILVSLGNIAKDLVVGRKAPEGLAGPIGMIHQAQTAGLLEQGAMAVLAFAAMLSINLAVFNVLPIPPLDGGRGLFIVLDNVLHERYSKPLQYYFQYGGLIMLLLLVILVTAQDLYRIIIG